MQAINPASPYDKSESESAVYLQTVILLHEGVPGKLAENENLDTRQWHTIGY